MATGNLLITHLLASQNNKEVTVNEALDILDGASHGFQSKAFTANVNLTVEEFRENFVTQLTGGSAGTFTLTIPSGYKKAFYVFNLSAATALVQVNNEGSDATTVNAGSAAMLYATGTDIIVISNTSIGGAAGAPETTENVTGATYTVTDADFAGGVIKICTSASAQQIRVPTGISNGQSCLFIAEGGGTVSFEEEDSAVNIKSADDYRSIRTQFAWALLKPDPNNANDFFLSGDLA